MKSHRSAILKALEQSDGERSIAKYLKVNPTLILNAFAGFGNHDNYVLAEFGLGKSHKADFVVLQASSAGWDVDFVELEPVVDSLFNNDRTPTKRLRIAQKQIADWRDYVRIEGASLRRQLAGAAKKDDLLEKDRDDGEPCTLTGMRLRDPQSYISYNYHIVIGRREMLSKLAQQLRSRSFHDDAIHIATYDRLIDVAADLDSQLQNATKQ